MDADGLIWITGASAGIGRAVALELSRRGKKIAVTARRREELASLAAQSASIFSYPGDVTDAAQMSKIVTGIEAERGPIGLAFLNAGVYFLAERENFDAKIIWETFRINVGGTVNCLDPVLNSMQKRGRGHIVLNASLAGYSGIPGSAGYAPSKAALINLAEGLRLTYQKDGVKIQVVNPGFVETAMTAQNDFFDMPFLMPVEAAAKRICDGFEKPNFEITFPYRLAYIFKAARLLPYGLFLPLMHRATNRMRGESAIGKTSLVDEG
jgi:short-subunit dehydrogenase